MENNVVLCMYVCSTTLLRQLLAWIHDVKWVKCSLDRLHRRYAASPVLLDKEWDLPRPNAMLACTRAPERYRFPSRRCQQFLDDWLWLHLIIQHKSQFSSVARESKHSYRVINPTPHIMFTPLTWRDGDRDRRPWRPRPCSHQQQPGSGNCRHPHGPQ